VTLARDVGLTCFALRVERVELLLEPIVGRLACAIQIGQGLRTSAAFRRSSRPGLGSRFSNVWDFSLDADGGALHELIDLDLKSPEYRIAVSAQKISVHLTRAMSLRTHD
jgi:hypothetical protein